MGVINSCNCSKEGEKNELDLMKEHRSSRLEILNPTNILENKVTHQTEDISKQQLNIQENGGGIIKNLIFHNYRT